MMIYNSGRTFFSFFKASTHPPYKKVYGEFKLAQRSGCHREAAIYRSSCLDWQPYLKPHSATVTCTALRLHVQGALQL